MWWHRIWQGAGCSVLSLSIEDVEVVSSRGRGRHGLLVVEVGLFSVFIELQMGWISLLKAKVVVDDRALQSRSFKYRTPVRRRLVLWHMFLPPEKLASGKVEVEKYPTISGFKWVDFSVQHRETSVFRLLCLKPGNMQAI